MGEGEIAPWLKGLPLAPEYRPTEAEFADPIGYISKIENEASQYGICKIVPPLPKPPKKLVISNISRSLVESQDTAVATAHGSYSLAVSHSTNTMPTFCPAFQLGSNKDESFQVTNGGDGDGKAKFTTRHQQIGWNPRKLRGPMQSIVQKPVWQSGESYTLEQFEAKARAFYRSRLGTAKEVSPLAIETMFWKAASDRPISVEYANDIPGTAFGEPNEMFACPSHTHGRKGKMERELQAGFNNPNKDEIHQNMQATNLKDNNNTDSQNAIASNHDGTEDIYICRTGSPEMGLNTDNAEGPIPVRTTSAKMSDHQTDRMKTRSKRLDGNTDREVGGTGWKLSNSAWNMRIVARSPGSLICNMPDEVPGVTSPMVYIGMLFSWFAWHVEDHELHSLNYLHTGSPKTWYAVPGDAALSLEEVIRVQGYGEHISPLAAFAILGEKTTLMSPEILLQAGVPCCRLVQNPGEFVVTFPRAYHLGFSHGFNCGEAANFATPSWLKVAKEAAVRRAAMNYLPMLSHQQLLYMIALSFPSRIPASLPSEPRSSRLKDRKRGEGEMAVKKHFVNDMIDNNRLLCDLLEKESTCYAVLWDSAHISSNCPSSPSCFSTITHAKCGSSFGASCLETLPSNSSTNGSIMVGRKEGSCAPNILEMNENLVSESIKVGNFLGHHCQQGKRPDFSNDRFTDVCVQENSMGGQSLDSDSPSDDSMHLDSGTLACVACGVLGFPCMAIIQLSEEAARNLLPSDYKSIDEHYGASAGGPAREDVTSIGVATTANQSIGLELSTKDSKGDFCKRRTQHSESEFVAARPKEVTEMDNIPAIRRSKFNVMNLSSQLKLRNASALSLCGEKSLEECKAILEECKAILEPMAEDNSAVACSENVINNEGEYDFKNHSSSLFSSSASLSGRSTISHAAQNNRWIVRDVALNKELPHKYPNDFPKVDNKNEASDSSTKFINRSMSNAFSVPISSIKVQSALDLLAATYNDESDSDELDDIAKNGKCHPAHEERDVALDNVDIAGFTPLSGSYHSRSSILEENTQLSSPGSGSKISMEGTEKGITRVLFSSDKVSSLHPRQNDSLCDILKQNAGFKKGSLLSLSHFPERRASVSESVTDNHGDLHVNGLELFSPESSNLLEQSILTSPLCQTSVKGTPGGEALPSNQLSDGKIEFGETSEKISETNEGIPSITFSSVKETKKMTVCTLDRNASILDAGTVSKCITECPEVCSVVDESSADFSTSYSEQPSIYDQRAAKKLPLENDLNEDITEDSDIVSMPVMTNVSCKDVHHNRQASKAAQGNMLGSAAGNVSQENIPVTENAMGKGRTSSLWKPCKGFMRPHVFCLEHALEVEEQLRAMGGAHLLILCHADYPKIEKRARLLAKEIGADYSWKENPLRNAAEDDLEMIRVAIEEQDDAELGRDWTAQLGVSLRYSVKLSRSSLYSKQMPYNKVLDALFCGESFDNDSAPSAFDGSNISNLKWQFRNSRSSYLPMRTGDSKKKVSKQKKITVAGKWCGRVWMVNQVHPYLAGQSFSQQPAFLSNQIGCSEVSGSRGCPRKLPTTDLDSRSKSKICAKEISDEQLFIHPTNTEKLAVDRNLLKKRKIHMEETIIDSKMKVQLFKDKIIDTAVEDPVHFVSLPDPKPEDPLFGASVGMTSCEDICALSKRKLDIEPSLCVTAGKDSKHSLLENRVTSKVEGGYLEQRDSKIRKIQMAETHMGTDGNVSQACKFNLDSSLSCTQNQIETVKTEYNADKYSSLDQEKCGELSSRRSDSKEMSEQLKLSTSAGIKSSLPGSCQITSAGKARSKRKKQACRNNSFEVLQNPAGNNQGDNNMPNSDKHAIPGSEAVVSCEPDASQEQTSLCFSVTSGYPSSGPTTRLRIRSRQANVATIAKDVDKVSTQQRPPSSRKMPKRNKKVVNYVPSKDVEDEGSYPCDIEGCIMTFQTKQELLMHKRNACTFKGCGKRFGSHKYLIQHRRVHDDDRPLKCLVKGCKMTFKWAWARTEHKRIHTGERPYVCPIAGCGKTFRFVSDFSRHKRKTGHAKQ